MSFKHTLIIGLLILPLFIISNCKKKLDDLPCRNPNAIDIAGEDSMQYEIAYKHEEVKTFIVGDSSKIRSNTVSNNKYQYNDNYKITFFRSFHTEVSDSVRTIMDIKNNEWSCYCDDPKRQVFSARIGGINYDLEFCNAESNHNAALSLDYFVDLPNGDREFITYILYRVK